MKKQLALAIIFAISGIGAAHAQDGVERLQPLVATSARRLALAEQVALAKWDSGASVDDAPREAQVIKAAVEYGESRGLERTFVADFFTAQIEANKFIQRSLLADWHRIGGAPAHRPISLARIRLKLDRLQTELIDELADTAAIRATPTCGADAARAVAKYEANRLHGRPLQAAALDRAMAAVCTSIKKDP